MVDPEARPSPLVRYAGGLAVTAAAVLIRWALEPALHGQLPFSPLPLAIVIVARYLGLGPSLLATATGGLGAMLVSGERRPLPILVFCLSALVIIWAISALRRATAAAREQARLAAGRLEDLERETAQRLIEGRHSAQFRAIVESSEDAIFSEDLHGTIQSWNLGAEKTFGFGADEAVGSNISILVPSGRQNEEDDIIAKVRRGEHVKPFITTRRCKDGAVIPVSLTISPIHHSRGRVAGVSHISRDIREQIALEEQLREKQKMESLGVLAGGVAHDFNNLLTGIMGNTSLILDDPSTNFQTRRRAYDILGASERAALLVRQMLAYAGKARTTLERIDLSAMIQEFTPLLCTSIPRLVQLELQLDPAIPLVNADRQQMQQLLMNLVINAAEAMETAPGTVTLITRTIQDGSNRQVVLEVRDTGSGMDEATRGRIFDPFFTTKFTGRGLGLAAVTGIIRAHHGAISVESSPGNGSTFTVTLPAPDELSCDGRNRGTVLVVDDEELVCNLARQTLERCGYRVEVAADGRAAVETFSARPADFVAVLLDLTMPVMGGEETLRHIRQIRPGVAVVLTSGYSEDDAVRRFQDQGLHGFLQKPYTAATLVGKMKQAVR